MMRAARTAVALNPYTRAGAITAAALGSWYALRRRRKAATNMLTRIGKTGKAIAKRENTLTDIAITPMATRILYANEMQSIGKGTNNEINLRQRDVTHISGFKICIEMRNNFTVQPLYVNVAVVYDKRSNDGTTVVSQNDFFRSRGGNTRAQDFGLNLGSTEFRCLPLNTDRFSVLRHKRFMLMARDLENSTYASGAMRNFKIYEDWISLKRKITFEDGSAQSKIWLLMWCDGFMTVPGAASIPDALSVQRRVTVYFREPKG